jgi:hypothetical protein
MEENMIIYNVTIKVDWAIHDDWLQWMQEEHIPLVINTGCFYESKILRILEIDEDDGPTYAVQYHARTADDYKRYIQQHASSLAHHSDKTWGDQTIAFRSVMEVLH